MVARAVRTRAFGRDARARGRARARGAPCASRSSSATEAVTTPARRARRGAGARAGTARGAGRAPRRAPSVAAAGAATAAETAALHIAAVDRRGRGGACACAKCAPREAKRGGRSSAGGARERRGRGRGMAPVGEMARISRRLVAERRALEPRAGHSWIEDSRRWRPNGVGDSEIDQFFNTGLS